MNEYQREIVKLQLDKLFNESKSFDITVVRNLGDMIGKDPSNHQDFEYLRGLHCVDYSKMSSSLKAQLPTMIINTLMPQFDTDSISKALAAVANNEIKPSSTVWIEDSFEVPHLNLFNSKY